MSQRFKGFDSADVVESKKLLCAALFGGSVERLDLTVTVAGSSVGSLPEQIESQSTSSPQLIDVVERNAYQYAPAETVDKGYADEIKEEPPVSKYEQNDNLHASMPCMY